MFNPAIFENSLAGGCAVLQVVEPADVGEGTERPQRFVPLQSSKLSGEIEGPLASLCLQHTFGYTSEQFAETLEALYRFPLPGDAAVVSVTVHFGETVIETRLVERKLAEAAYADATQRGEQAVLVAREAPDVFTLQITGLRPDEEVVISTCFVQLARMDEGAWTLRVPLTTAPRYVRCDELDSAHAKGQPFSVLRDPGHRFALSLQFHDVEAVTSTTHELLVETSARMSQVKLASGEVLPDRDCVLVWRHQETEDRPTLSVYAHDDDDFIYLLALLTPPGQSTMAQSVAREVILLVDHSGSMAGPKWAAADWAVERFLGNMQAPDSFALCLFHDSTSWYRQELASADAASVEDAVTWLGQYHDSGGTNLGLALEEALAISPGVEEATRSVLLITDAQVTDDGRILRLVNTEASKRVGSRRRIHVLCIDAAPNAYLAHQMAERGGGTARFFTSDPNEGDITTALDRMLAVWAQPALSDLRMLTDQGSIEASDRRVVADADRPAVDLGDLPATIPLWTVCRVPRDQSASLTLRIEAADGQLAEQLTVDLSVAQNRPHIKKLFGVRRVNALEQLLTADYRSDALAEQLQHLGYDASDILALSTEQVYVESRRKATDKVLQKLLVREALDYGLPSVVTSFVAVRRVAGERVDTSVVIANALPSGWAKGSVPDVAKPGTGPAFQPPPNSALPGLGPPSMPTPAGMPMPSMMPGSLGIGPADTGVPQSKSNAWTTIFSGTLSVAGERRILFDSESSSIQPPASTTISGIRINGRGVVDREARASRSIVISIYIGDMAEPRAKMTLTDLIRFGERPLNLRRVEGERVLITLDDPCDKSTGRTDPLILDVQW